MFREARSISPKVFISSTVEDLRDLRSALDWTLQRQGLTVFLSEVPGFALRGDRSAFDECFANIRECDYYILIIGGKRGTVNEEGVSITRQEYRVARRSFRSSGRPRLLLYLRSETQSALNSRDTNAIDDIDHLSSFINEVEHPAEDGAPQYLTRFHGFPELMNMPIGLTQLHMFSGFRRCIIRNMKLVWVGIMGFAYGGWFAFMSAGISRSDRHGMDIGTISFFIATVLSIALGIYAFYRASKLGKKEDEDAQKLRDWDKSSKGIS